MSAKAPIEHHNSPPPMQSESNEFHIQIGRILLATPFLLANPKTPSRMKNPLPNYILCKLLSKAKNRGEANPPKHTSVLSLLLTKQKRAISEECVEEMFSFMENACKESVRDGVECFQRLMPHLQIALSPFPSKSPIRARDILLEILKCCRECKNVECGENLVNVYSGYKILEVEHYNIGIEIGMRGNMVERAFDMYSLMISHIKSIPSSTYSILIYGYIKHQRISTAVDYYNLMKLQGLRIHDTITLNTLLDILVRGDNIAKGEEIFYEHLEHIEDNTSCVDIITFSTLARGLCKSNQLHKAVNLLTIMEDRNINNPNNPNNPNISADEVFYNCLLDGCSKAGEQELGHKLFTQMEIRGIPQSAITFNSLIDGYVRNGEMEEAWSTLSRMKELGIHPDSFTYATLVRGIKNNNQIEDLEKVFEMLDELENNPEFHKTPDEILYNVLIDACVCAKQLPRALSLLQHMKSPILPVSPDQVSYNTLIKGCALAHRVDTAFKLFREMSSEGISPNDITYNSLIDACVRSGRMDEAWGLLGEMSRDGITADNFTYSTLIKGIKYRGGNTNQELERAFTLLEEMKANKTIFPDEILYNCLIDACVRFRDINRAVALFSEMVMANISPSAITYGILIKAYGHSGQLENAFNAFSCMKEKGLTPNDVTYGCLIDACIKNNAMDKAMKVYVGMQTKGIAPNTIISTTMIKGFSKLKDLPGALEVFGGMGVGVGRGRDTKSTNSPNNVTYNSLIDCCVKCEKMFKASEMFEEMKSRGITPDLITYSTLIKGFCRGKDIGSSFRLLECMKKQGIVPDEVLFNSLLDGCCQCNELSLAFKVYDNMRSLGIPASNVTYSILVKLYGRDRQLDKAMGVIQQMKRERIKVGSVVYTCLLKTCIKLDNLPLALRLFEQMRAEGVVIDALAYTTIINGCRYKNMLRDASAIVLQAFNQGIRLNLNLLDQLLSQLLPETEMESLGAQIVGEMKRLKYTIWNKGVLDRWGETQTKTGTGTSKCYKGNQFTSNLRVKASPWGSVGKGEKGGKQKGKGVMNLDATPFVSRKPVSVVDKLDKLPPQEIVGHINDTPMQDISGVLQPQEFGKVNKPKKSSIVRKKSGMENNENILDPNVVAKKENGKFTRFLKGFVAVSDDSKPQTKKKQEKITQVSPNNTNNMKFEGRFSFTNSKMGGEKKLARLL